MKIAVLGAGLTGVLAALELAEAGHVVSIFDRRETAFGGASLACEGKIHLGYVYALDHSFRTAQMMLRGAAVFRPLIERWTGAQVLDRAMSAPFVYAVPDDSLLSVNAIRTHFQAVSDAVQALTGPMTLPKEDGRWEELSVQDYGQTFDPGQIKAVFQTEERAIDTTELALALREALMLSPRIVLRTGCHITAVTHEDPGYLVQGNCGRQSLAESFEVVVNCLWEHRIQIDATLGLPVDRDVIHRFKYGLFTRDPKVLDVLANVTFLIGAYGDTVRFPNSAYVSWYPVGLISQEVAVKPRVQDPHLAETDVRRIISGSLQNLRRLMPGVASALVDDPAIWTLKGGFVTAWGRCGIEDKGSELHERHDVGVFTQGDYHSIDTGKLTLGPMFAAEVCARILERHGAPR